MPTFDFSLFDALAAFHRTPLLEENMQQREKHLQNAKDERVNALRQRDFAAVESWDSYIQERQRLIDIGYLHTACPDEFYIFLALGITYMNDDPDWDKKVKLHNCRVATYGIHYITTPGSSPVTWKNWNQTFRNNLKGREGTTNFYQFLKAACRMDVFFIRKVSRNFALTYPVHYPYPWEICESLSSKKAEGEMDKTKKRKLNV